MRILVLDDDKTRQKTFKQNLIGNEVVRQALNYYEAEKYLKREQFDLIYLDHDLNLCDEKSVYINENGEERELIGTDVARLITEMDKSKYPKKCIIHSYNSGGAENIMSVLKLADIECYKEPFHKNIGLK